jgi:hypothetical protein
MISNIFLILPVGFAAFYHAWLYLFFATGLLIFSPLYHWYKIYRPQSRLYFWFAYADYLLAIGAFMYMYYYAFRYDNGYSTLMVVLLSLLVLFFWYGRRRNYDAWHPWFHVLAPIVSSLILIAAHG